MPSRMSCSEVTTWVPPTRGHRAHDLVPDQRAGADDVDPAGVHERQRRPLGAGQVQQPVAGLEHVRRAERGEVDAVRVVGRQAERVGGDGGDRAGEARRAARSPSKRTVSRGHVDGGVDVARRRPAISSAVGGSLRRCRSVIRTQPMSTDRAASTVVGAADELGGAAAEVDDEVRTGGCRAPRSSPVAPRKESAASSSPGDDLGLDAEVREGLRDPATNSAGVLGVTGGRGGHEADPLDARAPRTARRTRRHRERCAPSPRGRSARCGRRPGRAARSPSAAARR